MTRRGASLPTTLLMSALLVTLAFTIAAVGVNHLTLAHRLHNVEQGKNLAEAALSKAIQDIQKDPKFGKSPATVRVQFKGLGEHDEGVVTFENGAVAGLPHSTNNLNNQGSVEGSRGPVPPDAVHLVARGTCNGVVQTMEAVLSVPTFRYAIASNAPVTVQGDAVITAARSSEDVLPDVDTALAEGRLQPGHVASNSNAANALSLDAETLGGRILVTGDALSPGGVDQRNGGDPSRVEVRGRTLAGNEAELAPLPDLHAEDFDPVRLGLPRTLPEAGAEGGLGLAPGLYRRTGDLTVTSNLYLNDAVLWVDGDVRVEGIVQGVGAVVSTQDLRILGNGSGSGLTADNMAALVANGDIELRGTDRGSSFFQGVVYGRGGIEVSDITLVGSLVGNGPSDRPVHVTRANLVEIPETVGFEFNYPFGPKLELGALGMAGGVGSEDFTVTAPNAQRFYDAAGDCYHADQVTLSDLVFSGRVAGSGRGGGGRPGRGLPGEVDLEIGSTNLTSQEFFSRLRQFHEDPILGAQSYPPPDTETPPRWTDAPSFEAFQKSKALEELQLAIDRYNDQYQKWKAQSMRRGHFRFDPNVFLQLKDKTRITLWRDI